MAKDYSDRQMKTRRAESREERSFFFPKAPGGPRTVVARSREEAEKKLASELKGKKSKTD